MVTAAKKAHKKAEKVARTAATGMSRREIKNENIEKVESGRGARAVARAYVSLKAPQYARGLIANLVDHAHMRIGKKMVQSITRQKDLPKEISKLISSYI